MNQPLKSPLIFDAIPPSSPSPSPATEPRPATELPAPIQEMRRVALDELDKRLAALFENAPRELLRVADRAAGDRSRRLPLDLIRTLEFERPHLTRSFARAIEQSFRALPRTRAAHADDAEEQAALLGLATKAAQLTPAAATLRERLEHAARALGAEVAPTALSPAALCEAWASALHGIELPFTERLLAYELFDRSVLARAGALYHEALAVLDRHGWTGAATLACSIDGRTLACLERVGAASDGADAALARELLALRDTPAVAQRLALVGTMFNRILADPYLPPGFAPAFERLRLPLIKTALADVTFIQFSGHPLSLRLHHVATLGVCARLGGAIALRQLDAQLQALPAQVDIAAGLVMPELSRLAVLPQAEAARFADAQLHEERRRRRTLLLRVRRIVAQELEVQTLGMRLPAAARRVVDEGLDALLAARALRHGVDHRLWHDAVDRAGQVLHSVQTRAVAEFAGARADLAQALRADFADAGLPADRVAALLADLAQAWTAPCATVSQFGDSQ